jgi:hypothetical protein
MGPDVRGWCVLWIPGGTVLPNLTSGFTSEDSAREWAATMGEDGHTFIGVILAQALVLSVAQFDHCRGEHRWERTQSCPDSPDAPAQYMVACGECGIEKID